MASDSCVIGRVGYSLTPKKSVLEKYLAEMGKAWTVRNRFVDPSINKSHVEDGGSSCNASGVTHGRVHGVVGRHHLD